MANNEIVKDPEPRLTEELEFIAAIRQGICELDNGVSVPIEEVEKELPSWITKLQVADFDFRFNRYLDFVFKSFTGNLFTCLTRKTSLLPVSTFPFNSSSAKSI